MNSSSSTGRRPPRSGDAPRDVAGLLSGLRGRGVLRRGGLLPGPARVRDDAGRDRDAGAPQVEDRRVGLSGRDRGADDRAGPGAFTILSSSIA